jgi:DNA mismatch repair protein MutS2
VSRPSSELDIRGQRFDEAMSLVDVYIDHSFRSGMVQVSIIHGLGSGALREGIRNRLAKIPYVKEFYDGGMNRSNTGETVIIFEMS